ncbi:hypothetical protein ACHAPJ_005762 [Fusarium lateritium]
MLKSMIKAIKKRRAAESNSRDSVLANPGDDIPALLRSVSGTMDRGHLRDVLDRIVEIIYLKSDCFAQQIVTMLTEVLEGIERIRDLVEEESEDEDLTDESGHEDGDE